MCIRDRPRTWYSHFHDNMRVSQGHAHRHPRKPHATIHVDAFRCPHCESGFFSSEQARQAHITGDCADAPQAQGGGGTLQETLEFYKTCDNVLQVNQASSVAPPEHASTGVLASVLGSRPGTPQNNQEAAGKSGEVVESESNNVSEQVSGVSVVVLVFMLLCAHKLLSYSSTPPLSDSVSSRRRKKLIQRRKKLFQRRKMLMKKR